MVCPKCGSPNVTTQVVTDMKLKDKHHGIIYWLFIGWWLKPMLWVFLTLPMIIIAIFRPKRQKLKTKQRTVCCCQVCGKTWNA